MPPMRLRSSRNSLKKSGKNVNSLIGSKDLLAQLDMLKSVIQEFSAREQKLNGTFRDQSAREKVAFDAREQEQSAALAKSLDDATDHFELAKERLASRVAARKARITRAHYAVYDRVTASIGAQDEECKRQAQQGLADAEQYRD